jgi:50S ribosomal subunit-associated GTPase HflX
LRLPREQEIIINDTVGFIRDLPPGLLSAFRATLEEIGDSRLLIHLVDISNSRWSQQIHSVERILVELHIARIPSILALNKADLGVETCEQSLNGWSAAIARSSIAATDQENAAATAGKVGQILSHLGLPGGEKA